MDSPCHHCPKCPCKEHDTCREYQEYRAKLDNIKKQKISERVVREMTFKGIARCKKWRNKKNG